MPYQGLLKLRKSLTLAKKDYDFADSFIFAEPAEPATETWPKKRPVESGAKPKKEKVKVSVGNQAVKPVAKRARGREPKPQQANPRKNGGQPDQGKDNPWIT